MVASATIVLAACTSGCEHDPIEPRHNTFASHLTLVNASGKASTHFAPGEVIVFELHVTNRSSATQVLQFGSSCQYSIVVWNGAGTELLLAFRTRRFLVGSASVRR